jgi:hypothetical protein
MKPPNLRFVLPDEHSPRVVASAARAGQQIRGYVHQIRCPGFEPVYR